MENTAFTRSALTRPLENPPRQNASGTHAESSVALQRDGARQTVHVLTSKRFFDGHTGKKVSYELPSNFDLRASSRTLQDHCIGRFQVVAYTREMDVSEVSDQNLADVLDQIEVTRDSFTDLKDSGVTLDTSRSVDRLSEFIKMCLADTTLRLPKLPQDKGKCRKLAEAMQQRVSRAQLKVVFSQSHTGGEFLLAKWTYKDLLDWTNMKD